MKKVGLVGAVLLSWGLLSVASAETYTPGQKSDKDYGSFAKSFLANYCLDCHGVGGRTGVSEG